MRSAKPIGIIRRAGQTMSPPALVDTSWRTYDSTNSGQPSHIRMIDIGSRNSTMPITSIQFCKRGEKRADRMSIRTCSLRSSVYPAPNRKITENRYHWISRYAFEL
jgi:hypothetical protein